MSVTRARPVPSLRTRVQEVTRLVESAKNELVAGTERHLIPVTSDQVRRLVVIQRRHPDFRLSVTRHGRVSDLTFVA